MPTIDHSDELDTVRASRAGHTFHERWAARRALQLVFPKDNLFAIAVEGLSSTETAKPGDKAEEVADLVLYYGNGNNFAASDRLETVQFKYKLRPDEVTASFLRKTIEKFCATIVGYEKDFTAAEVDAKTAFIFVTNASFGPGLWEALAALQSGVPATSRGAGRQVSYLTAICAKSGVPDPKRLFSRVEFRAAEKNLQGQSNALRRTLTDWSAGADSQAKLRLHDLQDLVLKKAGPSGQGKNLIRREDVLDALDCEPEDLFPADTRFVDVGAIVERTELDIVGAKVAQLSMPIFVHAEGGVGKTVFVQSLAARLSNEFEVVVFDCFGGGAYRSEEHSRHLPSVGIVQIVNELASRGLCDLLLPSENDNRRILKAARKRFSQAATAIVTQSKKRGLLIIIDAADNAQLEADYRREDAFPKLLLSMLDHEPIDGVKLMLTARTHRKDTVIARARVEPFELGPFTEPEARQFLEARRPTISEVEVATALSRSGRNARVLDYLLTTWDINVSGTAPSTPITVKEIIAQRCAKIVNDLHIAGWPENEVREFFVALSLLPPPIPLDDLAGALGWPASQVNTAASDLAPMLELTPHGAIFRDEPTETYVRETYSSEVDAQRVIADRLLASQASSSYAAEALPHFLVVINDSDRAFALADSSSFPSVVQSEFGRRRLSLARLRAAFRLAVAAGDFDRVLNLTMRLAQVATANMRGDEFIRRSPALAVTLGDPDAQRRLFADRSGWRGARSARLTISYSFAGDAEEAMIQRESTIRWINWHSQLPGEDPPHDRAGPETADFAAVLFASVLHGDLENVDHNLTRWTARFSLAASDALLTLLDQLKLTTGDDALAEFVEFAAGDQCKSAALKICLLTRPQYITRAQAKSLSASLKAFSEPDDQEDREDYSFREDRSIAGDIIQAALTVLLTGSRSVAASLMRNVPEMRPSGYDYSERYGHPKVWQPLICACVRAWSAGKPLAYHDLLPIELKITKRAKAISDKKELAKFIAEQTVSTAPVRGVKKRKSPKEKARYNSVERNEIVDAIELALTLMQPIQEAILSKQPVSVATMDAFISIWQSTTRSSVHWRSETAVDLQSRTLGLACVELLFSYAADVTSEQARAVVDLVSAGRFAPYQKLRVLAHLARRPPLHSLAGEFARHVSEQIRKDENIGSRGEGYADLAATLVAMSVDEAREYYRQGLSQLDQMGGEDFQQIYSLLHYGVVQPGGELSPVAAQRLMNLCQAIAHYEPRKFGWTLFGRSAANSIGFAAIAKLVRWKDQDVVELSYGLPQLVCYLAKKGKLSPVRAALLLTLCKDHGWWDWQVGEGISDLLSVCDPADRKAIMNVILGKLRAEHMDGAWPTLWESLLKAGDSYPGTLTEEEKTAIEQARAFAKQKQDEFNDRNRSSSQFLAHTPPRPTKEQVDETIATLVQRCDPTSAASIDEAIRMIDEDKRLPFGARLQFVAGVRNACPYGKRLQFLFAICEATEFEFDRAIDLTIECIAVWASEAAHLRSHSKELIASLFEHKGAQLFDDRYSNMARRIHQLSELCDDKRFVLEQILKKVAIDEIELDGDEWLQLAISLCDIASGAAALEAFELLLSGTASRFADEIGEGPYRAEFAAARQEPGFLADILWHLLGDDDAYVRWSVARSLSTAVELGLHQELELLLDRFDVREVPALATTDRSLPFQNSQEWLLIGFARAAKRHGSTLAFLRPKLLALAQRADVHVMHKVHIARCLENIGNGGRPDKALAILRAQIDTPPNGTVKTDEWPAPAEATSGFSFDYEFNKSELDDLARLFGLPHGTVADLLASEIVARWPEAKDMSYFPGHDRYRRDRNDQHEYFREHVQKHALFSAATKLFASHPVVARTYDDESDKWREWRDRYDITFDDGSWLSDRKDGTPQRAFEKLLGPREKQKESLQAPDVVLKKLKIIDRDPADLIPLYGRWTSPDGVSVNITSALSERKGAVQRCTSFSKKPSHDFWLPEFWDGGYYDRHYRQASPFEPLVWAPEHYGLGIDQGEELAAHGAASRPRLGIDLTKQLSLTEGPIVGEWHDASGSLALESQVWGKWEPNPDQHKYRHQSGGEILWATPAWLEVTLSGLKRRLVSTITLWKYRSSTSYDETSGAKLVIVALRVDDGGIRFWHAKKASSVDY
ncbi:NACHT domain-containing protein [Brucella sp. BE17]|uniref:NACHT domain-containing protein n=1 Tax=Brucella sp. BE17 TaxID=3142977 RepID=UPI0031BA9AF1